MTKIETIGVMNDIHGPWHDPRSVNLVLDIFEDQGIDTLFLNGDIFDFHNINRHKKKDPRVQSIIDDEFYWGNEFFSDIRKRFINKGKKVIYKRGNHEEWLDSFILQNCPQFWNQLQLEKMVDLSGVDVRLYNEKVQIGNSNLFVQHSPPSYAKNGVLTSLEKKVDTCHIWGCTHRMQHGAKTGGSGTVYHSWFNGWLGSTKLTAEHKLVFKYIKGHENWQQCASIITLVDNKEFFVNQFPITNNRAVVGGFLYEG